MMPRKLTVPLALPLVMGVYLPVAEAQSTPGKIYFEGHIIVAPRLSQGHFDGSSARVKKADADLTGLLGHPLEFYFDDSLVPKWADDLAELSTAAVETVAGELAQMKRVSPDSFAYGAAHLRRIEWDYSATAEYNQCKFDSRTGRLVIVLTSRAWQITEPKAIWHTLARAYGDDLDARFAGRDAARVAASELPEYASYVLDYSYGHETERLKPKGDDETLDIARCRQVLAALRLYDAARGKSKEIEDKVTQHLISEVRHFASVRNGHAEAAERATPSSDYRRAETAFVAWVNAHFDSFEPGTRHNIWGEVAGSIPNEGGTPHALPGFDALGVWTRTADAWIKAGHPVEHGKEGADRVRFEFFQEVLGPQDIRRDERVSCARPRAMYRIAAKDEAQRKAIFGVVLARKDPFLLRAVLANLLELETNVGKPQELGLALWRATEKDDALYRAATRTVAGFAEGCSHSDALFDELARMWKAHPRPAQRGALFFAIRQFGTHRDSFSNIFGRLSRAEFAAYLDEESDPVRELHFIWPTLAAGYSHGEVVVPRLDSWLTDEYRRKESWWGQGLTSLADDLCSDKDTAALKRLHTYAEERMRAHPSEEGQLRQVLERSQPGGCH
jgi:hypothetical protein